MADIIDGIECELARKDKLNFRIGDTVDVYYRIREGNKERIQVFTGTVIARKHSGVRETFTVRRIVSGEGVERVFPVCSPRVTKVKVKRSGRARRGKLYYLRSRVGKATRLKEERSRPRPKRREHSKEKAQSPGENPPQPSEEEKVES